MLRTWFTVVRRDSIEHEKRGASCGSFSAGGAFRNERDQNNVVLRHRWWKKPCVSKAFHFNTLFLTLWEFCLIITIPTRQKESDSHDGSAASSYQGGADAVTGPASPHSSHPCGNGGGQEAAETTTTATAADVGTAEECHKSAN